MDSRSSVLCRAAANVAVKMKMTEAAEADRNISSANDGRGHELHRAIAEWRSYEVNLVITLNQISIIIERLITISRTNFDGYKDTFW